MSLVCNKGTAAKHLSQFLFLSTEAPGEGQAQAHHLVTASGRARMAARTQVTELASTTSQIHA